MHFLKLSKKIIWLVIVVAVMSGCAFKSMNTTSPTPIATAEIAGSLLHYSESQQGEDESDIRILVTKDILRIDAGPKSQNYRLYDRRQKRLYDVNVDDRTIRVASITINNISKPDFPLNWTIESQASHAVMHSVDGSSGATHHQFKLNQQACYDTVTVNSVLDDVTQAMSEYYLAIASRKKNESMLKESLACRDAIEIFSPANHLKAGFPVREWSAYGFQRFLIDYRAHIILPRELFILPVGFSKTIQ